MANTLIRSAVAAAIVVAAVAIGAATPSIPAGAAVLEVTEIDDDATVVGSLRWAVEQADADPTPPTITLAPGLSIELTCLGGGALAYDNATDQPLVIEGNLSTITQTCPGEAVLETVTEDLEVSEITITGGGAGGIVGGGDVAVSGATVTGNQGGPGVSAYSGRATITASTVSDNVGAAGGGVGAIHIELVGSTVSGNEGNNGAGVWADQTATVTNSTVSGNTAGNSGGGVYSALNTIELTHATVVENAAPAGANVDLDSSSTFTSTSSLIGLPAGGGENCEIDGGATVTSGGYNVTSDASCQLSTGPGDLSDTDPQVGPLADNGGPAATHLPAVASPAIDLADCAAAGLAADERGIARPQAAACDSGAVEVEDVVLPDPPVPDPGPGPGDPFGPARPAAPLPATPVYTG